MGELRKLSAEELAALREQIMSGNKNLKMANMEAEAAAQSYVSAPESQKQIDVKVAEDRMCATITLADPGDECYEATELVMALRSKKVVIGIDMQTIMGIVAQKQYNTEIVVAKGKPMVASQEGYHDYLFDTEEHKTPEIRADGSADYSAVGRLANVEAGQKIAIYHPAKPGENGYDITGNEKVAKPAIEKPLLRGQFIEYNEETHEYFAKKAGKISLRDNNVEILDVHEISGNVTMIQEKVEFFGDLYIHGDVENGVVIRAGRNVIIDGTVGAASIMAGGDIILQKGIQGAGKGKVSARGNIFSDFIEYAHIEAGQDVYANSIMNSQISTQGNVIVSGNHGSIIGGDTHGLRSIVTNAAGNESEIRTQLHAGFPEEDYEKYLELSREEKRVTLNLESVVEQITKLFKASAKAGAVTKAVKQEILKYNETKQELQKRVEKIKEDKLNISRKMSLGVGAYIEVRGEVYRNVAIGIDTAKLIVLKNESYVRYICKNDTIERRTVLKN